MSIDSDTTDIIRSIPGFDKLDADSVSAIASASSLRSVADDTALYVEDETSLDAYFIVSGIVSIRTRIPGSETFSELLTLRSGAFFGVLSFLDGSRRHMSAVARGRSLVLRMDGALLKAACESSSVVGRAVYERFGQAAANNSRDISMELRNLLAERS
ncbi:MAG: hypothetical protein CVV47_12895 [Spirochaetae bacterium HGW-Spirochaetae-3]|jgi:CRP-like cAMP-binding protein|nr:MAG: hypothetical protein CVV47_12895 [Spirochaetae bacterium HGW-Spirochaetae-3]